MAGPVVFSTRAPIAILVHPIVRGSWLCVCLFGICACRHFVLQSRTQAISFAFEVVVGLQVYPKSFGIREVSGKP